MFPLFWGILGNFGEFVSLIFFMISFKFYIDKSDSLRLRVTNNRRKAEIVLGVKMSPSAFDD